VRISYVILRVNDMTRSLMFYRDEVGFSVVSESPEFSFLDGGSIQLALNQRAEPSPRDESLTEIVIEVDDVAAMYGAMNGRGVDFRIEPREVMRHNGGALHAADFLDPDGHVLSITGWVDAG
jgi:catechol 2,3-dioxygenase-like lactoylglutathione lyase family enzyme